MELDKFSSFVKEVARNLVLPDGRVSVTALLEKAMTAHSARRGIATGKTVSLMVIDNAKRSLHQEMCQLFVAPPFSTALDAAYSAILRNDSRQFESIGEWLTGSDSNLLIESCNSLGGGDVKIRAVGPSLAEEHLRVIALLCQTAGFKGLFIGVDELEIIGRLPAQRKANSFQTLRALVDQNHSRRQPPATCLFLAATPEMFEDPDKIPSYKALQDRIESLPSLTGQRTTNFRACVIDLDRTELGKDDLRALAESVVSLHKKAYGDSPHPGRLLDDLVAQVVSGKYTMARPRLLCRCVIDLLNGQLSSDLAISVSARARALQEGREKELSGR